MLKIVVIDHFCVLSALVEQSFRSGLVFEALNVAGTLAVRRGSARGQFQNATAASWPPLEWKPRDSQGNSGSISSGGTNHEPTNSIY